MGILSGLLGGAGPADSWAPDDDRWYGPLSEPSATGVRVSPETAMRVTAVYRCVQILAATLASLPLLIYRRLPGGGKDRASDHPLYDVLHRRPNGWQTSFEFRQMLMTHLCLRGNAYAEILPGERGFADRLEPLHPDRVVPELVTSGRLRYRITDRDGSVRQLTQDEVMHLRGLSTDGYVGLGPVAVAREAVGLSLATEEHGARLFSNAARPSGVLETDKALSEEAVLRLRKQWETVNAGLANAGKTVVLEQGLKWHQVSLSAEDAQFLETRRYQVEEIARLFGVPPHMIGATDKTTSWGTGIEQQTIGFVTFTMRPWLVSWEQAIARDLILRPETYFAEFSLEGLLRGDSAARAAFYQSAIINGWMSPNEVRDLEGRNARSGGDAFWQPANMVAVERPGRTTSSAVLGPDGLPAEMGGQHA